MLSRKLIIFTMLTTILVLGVTFTLPPLAEQKIYWTNNAIILNQAGLFEHKIQRSNLDGSNVETIMVLPSLQNDGIRFLAIDDLDRKIYWAERQAPNLGQIRRANLDGSNIENIVTTIGPNLTAPDGIALDLIDGKIYWTDSGDDGIRRADLNGNNVETLISLDPNFNPRDIDLDVANGRMYFAADGPNLIQSANLDGSSVQDVIASGLFDPDGISLDLTNGKVYWTDEGVFIANLDGSGEEFLAPRGIDAQGIVTNSGEGKIYWADRGTSSNNGAVYKADLDGENRQLIVGGLSRPWGIAIGPSLTTEEALLAQALDDLEQVQHELALCEQEVAECRVCVLTHKKENGVRCRDGIDNDCDGLTDRDDPDCQ